MQLWYRVPKGMEIPNSVKKIGINVDIRGTGGQSVAPGSLHQSGNRYRWAPTRGPEDLKPSAPPDWLVEKIREVIADQQQAKLAKIQTEEINLSLSPKQWWAEWFSVHRREMMDFGFPEAPRTLGEDAQPAGPDGVDLTHDPGGLRRSGRKRIGRDQSAPGSPAGEVFQEPYSEGIQPVGKVAGRQTD